MPNLVLNDEGMRAIRTLVEEVLTICRWDDTGTTVDLIEPALIVAEEIGMTREEIEELSRP
jgi:hypothetical protein